MDDNEPVVDPVLKATITNLASALGGPDVTVPARPYKLGDDALACLRDLKRWLRAYDERLNRWDVARAIADTSLVPFDLVEILTQWETVQESLAEGVQTLHMDRIALGCLELLVPLTWPLELDKESSPLNHFRHYNALVSAQIRYKRAILNHPRHCVLKAVLRLAVPSLEKDAKERAPRDEGVIRLMVFFFRNLLAIAATETDIADPAELEDVSRSDTVIEFQSQSVFDFIVSFAGNIQDSFSGHALSALDLIFQLCRGLRVRSLGYGSASDSAAHSGPHSTVASILEAEKVLQRSLRRAGPTRHSRFGTMLSIVTPEHEHLVVTGPGATGDSANSLAALDRRKPWRKPGGTRIEQGEQWNLEVGLTGQSRTIMRDFINNFLEFSFNELIVAVRKIAEQDLDAFTLKHRLEYLYVTGFFLEADRAARKESQRIQDYGSVAKALDQRAFIIYMGLFRESHDPGEHHSMKVMYTGMLCFKQVLLTVQDMQASVSELDRDMAINMLSRLFHEEYCLDLLAHIPRSAIRQSLEFVAAAVELTHIVLKTLESFTKQHTTLYIRSKRRRQKKHKAAAMTDPEEEIEDGYGELASDQEAKRVTAERKFSFAAFQRRFVNEATLDTYKRFLQGYRELSAEQISWALKFLHRIFFRMHDRSLLYSLDLLRLFEQMTNSKTGLRRDHGARKDVDNFVVHYMRELTTALERTPSLYVELLFEKMPSTRFFFDNGYEEVVVSKKRNVAQYEIVDKSLDWERKVAIAVAVLLDEDKRHVVEWLAERLGHLVDDRENFSGMINLDKVQPEAVGKSAQTDGKFRLLLSLVGFEVSETEASLVLPGTVTNQHLENAQILIKRYLFEVVEFEGDKVAADFVVRKTNEDESEAHSYERDGFVASDSEGESGDDVFADARLQPLPESERLALELSRHKTKKSKNARKRPSEGRDSSSKKRKSTRQAQLERIERFKSSAFVNDSDDEEDTARDKAFFENERLLRERLEKAASMGIDPSQLASPSVVATLTTVEASNNINDSDSQSSQDSDSLDSDADIEDLGSSQSPLEPPSLAEINEKIVRRNRAIVVDSDEE